MSFWVGKASFVTKWSPLNNCLPKLLTTANYSFHNDPIEKL